MTYNTRQKALITKIISEQSQEFTVKDIYNELIRLGEEVGLTTIYRVADELLEAGKLRKNISAGGIVRYQYLEECGHSGHCYLKCGNCGRLEHMDCRLVKQLMQHVAEEHGFEADERQIIINGNCKKCCEAK
jgi:Fur family ferric uptake transcriptional regulator